MRVEQRKVWLVELDHFERDMLLEILPLAETKLNAPDDESLKKFIQELEQKMGMIR